ncbi:MAG: hypothetical protein U0R24_07450 [Solirubrobacterales bacterium]
MTKRLPLILATLIACLAVGAVTAAAKDKTIGSTITVKYKGANPNDPYGTSYFSGKVGPKACADDRVVKIKGVGKTETEDNGKFKLTLNRPAAPGKYKVSAASSKDDGVTCKKVKATLKLK